MSWKKLLVEAGVPVERHEEALASIDKAKKLASTVNGYKWKAPFVMAWVVQTLEWAAESLPEKWRPYDNNVSINGDVELVVASGLRKPVPLEKDSADAISMCYWAKGHHPRSKWARWVWLGWRNRASRAALEAGVHVPEPTPIETWGDPSISTAKPGIFVMHAGSSWQIRQIKKYGPVMLVRNLGFKINNLNKIDRHAPVTYIAWSLKGSNV